VRRRGGYIHTYIHTYIYIYNIYIYIYVYIYIYIYSWDTPTLREGFAVSGRDPGGRLGCGVWGLGVRVPLWEGEGCHHPVVDYCITQHKAQGPSRTCNKSKEEEEECRRGWGLPLAGDLGVGFTAQGFEAL